MIVWTALAFAADRVEGADTLATGSAAVANPYTHGGIAANPGVLGLAERYNFAAAFSYGDRGIHWNVSAIDTRTSVVSFGVTYSGDRFNPPLKDDELPGWQVPGQVLLNRKRTHDIGVALGIPFANRKISLGVGGSLSFFNHDRQGKGTTGNLTAGLGIRPTPNVSFGVSGRNLLPIEDPAAERPLELLGGVWLGESAMGALVLEGGARIENADPLVMGAGLQFTPSENSALRTGWRFEDGGHNIALGGGLGTKEGSIDIGMSVPVDAVASPLDWTGMISLRFAGPDPESIEPN